MPLGGRITAGLKSPETLLFAIQLFCFAMAVLLDTFRDTEWTSTEKEAAKGGNSCKSTASVQHTQGSLCGGRAGTSVQRDPVQPVGDTGASRACALGGLLGALSRRLGLQPGLACSLLTV